MGTNTCVEERSSLLAPFDPKQWIATNHYPSEVWENQITKIKATIHVMLKIQQIEKYQYRYQHPKYLLSVINVVVPKNGVCNYEESPSLLMLQYVVIKLSQIEMLSYAQAFYALKCALKGYGQLSSFYGPLYTNDQLIMINQYGNIKVWINEDLTQNNPSITTLIRNQKLSVKKKINERIKKSIEKIVQVIENKCEKEFPYNFKQYIINFENYDDAVEYLDRFMTNERIQQVTSIDISKYVKNNQQQLKPHKNSGLTSLLSPSESFIKYQVAKLTQQRKKQQNSNNLRQLNKAQCFVKEKSTTPESKVQKKSVKQYRCSKNKYTKKCSVNDLEIQQIPFKTVNSFKKFQEIEDYHDKMSNYDRQAEDYGRVRIQYSSPSPQPIRTIRNSYSPISNCSQPNFYRPSIPVHFNTARVNDSGQSSKNTDKTFPSTTYQPNILASNSPKNTLPYKRQFDNQTPMINYPRLNTQNSPKIRFSLQNTNIFPNSPKERYKKRQPQKVNYSLAQIPQEIKSYNYSSGQNSFANNSMSQKNIQYINMRNNSTKHLRTESSKPQIGPFYKTNSFANYSENSFYNNRQRPIYSVVERQQFQSNNIVVDRDFINEISFKKMEKQQKIHHKNISSLNQVSYHQQNPQDYVYMHQNTTEIQNKSQLNSFPSYQQQNFTKQKEKIKAYLIESIQKSKKQQIQMQKFKDQLQDKFYSENKLRLKLGALSKQLDGRFGQIQSLSYSLIQQQMSDMLRSSMQHSQQNQSQVNINISLTSSQQNAQHNNIMRTFPSNNPMFKKKY